MSTSIFTKTLQDLIDFLDNYPNVLFEGDLNARSKTYGDSVTYPKGTALESALLGSSFRVLNSGEPTFHQFLDTSRQASVLDITFTNHNQQFSWTTINTHISNSHHKPIIITNDQIQLNNNNFFLDKISLLTNLSKLDVLPDLTNINTSINKEIRSCSRRITARTPKSWWDESLNEFFDKMTKARQVCNRAFTPENIHCFEVAKSKWYERVKNTKKVSWLSKIKELNQTSGSKDYWKFIKNLKCRNDPPYQPINWTLEQQNEFLSTLKSYTMNTLPLDLSTINIIHPEEEETQPFTFQEFEYVLSKKRKSTAAGQDGIKYEYIRALPESSRKHLLTAINYQWSSCIIPESWRDIKIVPIPKGARRKLNIRFSSYCFNECTLQDDFTYAKRTYNSTYIEKQFSTTEMLCLQKPHVRHNDVKQFATHHQHLQTKRI